jgi:hypothetical protein
MQVISTSHGMADRRILSRSRLLPLVYLQPRIKEADAVLEAHLLSPAIQAFASGLAAS